MLTHRNRGSRVARDYYYGDDEKAKRKAEIEVVREVAPNMFRFGYTQTHSRPFSSDWKPTNGRGLPPKSKWKRRAPRDAWGRLFVQINPAHRYVAMIVDCDYPDAAQHILDLCLAGEIAEPHWITVNPLTTRAQFGYVLKSPVHKPHKAQLRAPRLGPLKLFRAIREALDSLCEGDTDFRQGGLARNPEHPLQTTYWSKQLVTGYTLSQLITERVGTKMSEKDGGAKQIALRHMATKESKVYQSGGKKGDQTHRVKDARLQRAQVKSVRARRYKSRGRDEQIVNMYSRGKTQAQIVKDLPHVGSVDTVRRILRERGIDTRRDGAKTRARREERAANAARREARRVEVVSLRDVEGLTFSEIGTKLGISKPAASKLYRRASSDGGIVERANVEALELKTQLEGEERLSARERDTRVLLMDGAGHSQTKIAQILGVARKTVYNILVRNGKR